MSGQIEVGKWAVQYRGNPCCGYPGSASWVPFIVTEISPHYGYGVCPKCSSGEKNVVHAWGFGGNRDVGVDLRLLKRIDDLPTEETKELELEL